MKNVFTNMKLRYATRKRLVKCYTSIWTTLPFGAEIWTISRSSEDRINSLEMWVYRRMFKNSWKEMNTNEEVMRLVGPNKSLVNIIKESKIRYCGHLMRHDSLQKKLLKGKIAGKKVQEDQGRNGLITSKSGQERVMRSAKEWHRIEMTGGSRPAQSGWHSWIN